MLFALGNSRAKQFVIYLPVVGKVGGELGDELRKFSLALVIEHDGGDGQQDGRVLVVVGDGHIFR